MLAVVIPNDAGPIATPIYNQPRLSDCDSAVSIVQCGCSGVFRMGQPAVALLSDDELLEAILVQYAVHRK